MTLELQPDRREWKPGDSTWHPPRDVEFLELVLKSGNVSWVGTGGSFGGKSASREIFVIYRGRTQSPPRQQMWEVCLIERDVEVASLFVCDILSSGRISVAWLSGESTEKTLASLECLRVTKSGSARSQKSHAL